MAPLYMQEISLTLDDGSGPVEFDCNVHAATLEAAAGDVVTYVTLCAGGSMTRQKASTYTLHLIGVQDWDGTALSVGLARYLADHNGVAGIEAIYQAHGAGVAPSESQPAYRMTVQAIQPTYGGEAEVWAEFDVSLPVSGEPELLTAPPVGRTAEEPAEAAA